MDLTSDHPFWALKNGIPAAYPAIDSDQRCEVAILGAGITGALVAEALTADGHDVVMLDTRDICFGSTSASTALLQYEVDTHLVDLIDQHGSRIAEMAYRSCHESIDLIERKVEELRIECAFSRRPSVYLASRKSDWPVLKKEAAARRGIGIEVEEWNADMVHERFGFERPGALKSSQAAEVDPYRFAHGLLATAHRRGARIYDRSEVKRIETNEHSLTLETRRGFTVTARKLVVATGYESTELFDIKRFVDLRSSFALASEPLKEAEYWWERCLLWESARPYFYMRSDCQGRVILGGEDVPFRNGKTRDKLIHPKAAKLENLFHELFPSISMEPAWAWAGTFGETADGLAYIGSHEKHPHCLFALGFGGNGITYSMTAAEIIRAALKGKKHEYADAFRFDR
jgi:glycine/D-amino acid oxidase-like deaminating enzyme